MPNVVLPVAVPCQIGGHICCTTKAMRSFKNVPPKRSAVDIPKSSAVSSAVDIAKSSAVSSAVELNTVELHSSQKQHIKHKRVNNKNK